MHAQLEEEIFYPAFKALSAGSESEDLFYEASEEHHLVDIVLPALIAANPRSHEFAAKAKVLKDLKAWAARTLPTLHQHHMSAQEISAKLK
jgi:hypothetical protein